MQWLLKGIYSQNLFSSLLKTKQNKTQLSAKVTVTQRWGRRGTTGKHLVMLGLHVEHLFLESVVSEIKWTPSHRISKYRFLKTYPSLGLRQRWSQVVLAQNLHCRIFTWLYARLHAQSSWVYQTSLDTKNINGRLTAVIYAVEQCNSNTQKTHKVLHMKACGKLEKHITHLNFICEH